MRRFFPQLTRISLIVFVTLSLFIVSPAQKPPKRKKLKDFGSSLKRLKWNPEKNAAVELPNQSAPAANSEDDDVIRVDTSLVTCDLMAFDRYGKPVAGLTQEDFLVVEDGAPQTVGHFLLGSNINVPRTIVLIIDYSGSQLPYLKNSIAAAKVLVDKLGPNDLMAIVTDDVELIHDFTTDKKKLKKKLDEVQRQTERDNLNLAGFSIAQSRLGRSKQYSALMATLNEAFEDTDVRPIIIFQTDGDEAIYLRNTEIGFTIPEGLEGEALEWAKQGAENYKQSLQRNQTEFSLDDIYRAVERSRVTVYTVIPGFKLLGLTPQQRLEKRLQEREFMLLGSLNNMPADRREKFMERMKRFPNDPSLAQAMWRVTLDAKMQTALAGVAALTGGWTEFLEKPEQADGIYERIFSDINQRYIVGYYPTNKERDGKRRKIDFEVKGHPEYQIYGRRSYFAPSQ